MTETHADNPGSRGEDGLRVSRRTGAVVIGRNEGGRLRRCLESLVGEVRQAVYVDSGSNDGSVALAESLGVAVVALDLNIPFTAARARNEGFALLMELAPELDYVQFVDGDCELHAEWLPRAAGWLGREGDVAAVCGRLRERHPERSIYNRLCDMEWDAPPGETKACGGNMLIRTAAFQAAGGFLVHLIAGEEPELCLRLRGAGWRLWRLDAEMAFHDAAMMRFGQWWRRSMRTGYAFAEGAWLHGSGVERYRVREIARTAFWGLLLPLGLLAGTLFLGPWSLLAASIYPLQVGRLARRGGRSREEKRLRAFFIVLGKFPEAIGLLTYLYRWLAGSERRLIEYK